MDPYTLDKKQCKILHPAIEKRMGALEKVVAACLKEEQSDAAAAVNAEIKQLMQIRDDIDAILKEN